MLLCYVMFGLTYVNAFLFGNETSRLIGIIFIFLWFISFLNIFIYMNFVGLILLLTLTCLGYIFNIK